jgi:hypothetical protein
MLGALYSVNMILKMIRVGKQLANRAFDLFTSSEAEEKWQVITNTSEFEIKRKKDRF